MLSGRQGCLVVGAGVARAAGVGLARRGHGVETIAATSALVAAVHAAQDEVGEGPLTEAAWDQARFVQLDDLAADARWPRFGKAAARAGARSLLCLPLLVDGDTLHALTVLSSRPAAFDEEARELAVMFASYVAVALASARTEDSLRHAVRTRQLIGEAVGILASRHNISTSEAFGNLSTLSQERNIKVGELALRIVTEHDTQSRSQR